MTDSAFTLTKREEDLILQNSVERMINTTLQILESKHPSDNHIDELMDTNHQDWLELKELITKLWDRERDAIFLKRLQTVQERYKNQ